MIFRSIVAGALALAFLAQPSLAQTNTGSGPLTIAKGGTSAITASAARTALGVAIGSNVQAFDADLSALAGLTSADNKCFYFTGSGTAATYDCSSFGRSVANAADAAALRTLAGAVIGTNVQAYDADLAALAGLTSANNKCFYFTGSGTAATYDCSSFGRGLTNVASLSAAIDSEFSSTRGVVLYRGASGWAALAVGSSGQLLSTNGAGADPSWITAGGTGTVTSVAAGYGVSGGTITASGTHAVSLTSITASLGADVAMNNIANYFAGPTVAQGSTGTWFASGTVSFSDSSGAVTIQCKLWDGTTVISSVATSIHLQPNYPNSATLSGVITSPAGNIRMDCRCSNSTAASMKYNTSGNSKDSTVTAVRIQ